MNFQTDTDKLIIVVYHYRNNLYLKDICCLKWKLYTEKSIVHFKIDINKMNFVVHSYRTSLCLRDNEADLKLTEYQPLLTKPFYLLSYVDLFYKRCIVLDETTVRN